MSLVTKMLDELELELAKLRRAEQLADPVVTTKGRIRCSRFADLKQLIEDYAEEERVGVTMQITNSFLICQEIRYTLKGNRSRVFRFQARLKRSFELYQKEVEETFSF